MSLIFLRRNNEILLRLALLLILSLIGISHSGAGPQNQQSRPECAAIALHKMKVKWPKDLKGAKSGPTVKYTIEMNGSVSHVSLEKSSGSKVLDDAVLDAMKKTSYRPLKDGCGPQESVVTLTLDPLTG